MDPRADWAVDGKTSVGKQVTRGEKKDGWNPYRRCEARGWGHRGPHKVVPGWESDLRRWGGNTDSSVPPATPLTALPPGGAFVRVGRPVPVPPGRPAGRGGPGDRAALPARPSAGGSGGHTNRLVDAIFTATAAPAENNTHRQRTGRDCGDQTLRAGLL